MQWLYLLSIFGLSFLLGKIADFCAQTLQQIKQIARLNEFIAAFFILGAVTSAPEIVVAILSALGDTPQLSLGNLLGSNIVVLSLMLGLVAVFSGKADIKGSIQKGDFLLTLCMTGLPVLFIVDGYISRWDGVMLLGSFGAYLFYFFKRRHLYRNKPGPSIQQEKGVVSKSIFMFLLAVISLLTVSYILIEVSLLASTAWNISALVVGLLMISIGTNIPEAAFVAKQLSKDSEKYKDIATGILLGNVVFNAPTLGLLAVIRPFRVENIHAVWITSALLVVILSMLCYFMIKDRELSRTEGALLLLPYVCFVTYLLTGIGS